MEFAEEIRKNPYEFICSWMEEMFPYTGKKCFEILSLMIASLLCPDLPYKGKTVRSNINCLFLAPPGGGKTAIAKQFAHFAINPLEVESITTARLEKEMMKHDDGTLVVGDFARMANDKIIIKVLEGIMGEDKRISRKTMNVDSTRDVNMVGLLCGTPQDLSGYLGSGLIFRIVPIIIFHSPEEHKEIGKHINEHICEEVEEDGREEAIKGFFQELLRIKENNHPDFEQKITGYKVPKMFKNNLYEVWDKLTFKLNKETRLNFFRELQEGYRFLVSHAYLNIFNREVVDGKLIPIEEDLRVAMKLMRESIILKKKLLKGQSFARNIMTMRDLEELLNDDSVPQEHKDIIRNLVKTKK